ncbi:PREDICTED: endothelial cell-specific chemotaxis regulator [Elephantulus edwardii]|uniref:endothelial cell-specific chemotaxis regulator n=1 Tax=Elephantulus edwardii TaxID=28737 RepID=UPI0003F0606A|nr:PREDICTED: endothelial cell-specific chemotaxis regulator [Elephantulus edwardii]
MGTVGTAQLCWAILGFLLLQGHNFQPTTTQPTSPRGKIKYTRPTPGNFNSLSLTIETTSPNTEPPKKASETPITTHQTTTLRSNIMGGQSSPSVGLRWSQPQKHTSGLGECPSSGQAVEVKDTRFYLGKSQNITPESTTMSLNSGEPLTILPSPTSESVLTVAAFGVISFIVILVVVVIILVSVVSLRFKCRKNKESEDPQKPGSSGISESGSTANGAKDSITLISMKNINMNNSKGCSSAEKMWEN